MKKKISYLATFTIISLILSACTYTSTQSDVVSPPSPEPTVDEKSSPDNSLGYKEYTKSILDQNKDKRRVLFFYANWCPTCKTANEDFQQNMSKIPENTIVLRVNYNDSATDAEEKELARKYSVTYQHTFVQIDDNNNKIATWNGGQVKELLQNLK